MHDAEFGDDNVFFCLRSYDIYRNDEDDLPFTIWRRSKEDEQRLWEVDHEESIIWVLSGWHVMLWFLQRLFGRLVDTLPYLNAMSPISVLQLRAHSRCFSLTMGAMGASVCKSASLLISDIGARWVGLSVERHEDLDCIGDRSM